MATLVLLDQENVSHHGLLGLNCLSKEDKIITFIGKEQKLGVKLKETLGMSDSIVDIQTVDVGTKNAADYQLISCLTLNIMDNNYDKYIILSRDTGFDVSIEYLRDKYPNVYILRCLNLIEFASLDFLYEEICDKNLYESYVVYNLIHKSNHFNDFKNKLKTKISKNSYENYIVSIKPYYDCLYEEINKFSIKGIQSRKDELLTLSKELKTVDNTYVCLSKILNINKEENERYLKLIRRFLRKSPNIPEFEHRIKSNNELLSLVGCKRCDISKKISPYFNSIKKSLERGNC